MEISLSNELQQFFLCWGITAPNPVIFLQGKKKKRKEKALYAVIHQVPQEIHNVFLLLFLNHKDTELPVHGTAGFHAVSSL